MSPTITLIALTVLGIDVGWKPLDDGGVEYTIQLEPETLDRLKDFDDVVSDIPKDLDVRRLRITVGTDKLVRTTTKSVDVAKPELEPELPLKRIPASRLVKPGQRRPALDDERAADDNVNVASDEQPIDDASAEQSTTTEEPSESEDAGPKLIEPAGEEPTNPPSIEVPDEASEATTVARPVDDGFDTRDPQPRDEESDGFASPQPNRLLIVDQEEPYKVAPSRSFRSKMLDDPADAPAPRRPIAEDRYVEVPADNDYETAKPSLPSSFRTADNSTRLSSASLDREPTDRDSRASDAQWGPVVAIFFFLLLSMGANMWLGWIAFEARQRYQILLEKYRATSGKTAMEMV